MRTHLIIRDDHGPKNVFEWAPPIRIIAVVTLFASTLDLIADILLCSKISEFLPNFENAMARRASFGYFFFTGVSVLVYFFEMTDVCLTLKYDFENIFVARLAKSLVLVTEEVPLPTMLHVLLACEPRMAILNPAYLASCIKFIALFWGLVKFTKLRFFWFCLPINPKHDTSENIRRCFTFTLYRLVMLLVNISHILAIILVISNIMLAHNTDRPKLKVAPANRSTAIYCNW